jgi:hypothetical protein
VYNHYKDWTRKREIDMKEWDKWKAIYEPIEDIRKEIYENLMVKISLEELDLVLNTVKNWRTPGLSGISYDFIKHSGIITKEVLVKLMNICLFKQEFPKDWLNGCIYPIPKREDWGGDITLT